MRECGKAVVVRGAKFVRTMKIRRCNRRLEACRICGEILSSYLSLRGALLLKCITVIAVNIMCDGTYTARLKNMKHVPRCCFLRAAIDSIFLFPFFPSFLVYFYSLRSLWCSIELLFPAVPINKPAGKKESSKSTIQRDHKNCNRRSNEAKSLPWIIYSQVNSRVISFVLVNDKVVDNLCNFPLAISSQNDVRAYVESSTWKSVGYSRLFCCRSR